MNSDYPSSIFYKAGASDDTQTHTDNSLNKNINVPSKIFSNNLESDYNNINTPMIHSRLIDIHRTMLNSDFIPDGTSSDGEESTIQKGGYTNSYNDIYTNSYTDSYDVSVTGSSFHIPLNSSELSDSNKNSITIDETNDKLSISSQKSKIKNNNKNQNISKDQLDKMFFY